MAITAAEIRQARADAEAEAKQLGLMLVLALRYLNKYSTVKSITFDIETGIFYVNGFRVPKNVIRGYIDRLERVSAVRLGEIVDDLEQRKIDLDEWKKQHDRRVRAMLILSGALALGSIEQALRSGRVLGLIEEQLRYSHKFERAIRLGAAGTFSRIKWRAKSYAAAARVTYGIIEQTAREQFGNQKEARRIQTAAESCNGCIKWARKGWIPINLMPPIGSQQCKNYCKCYLIYR